MLLLHIWMMFLCNWWMSLLWLSCFWTMPQAKPFPCKDRRNHMKNSKLKCQSWVEVLISPFMEGSLCMAQHASVFLKQQQQQTHLCTWCWSPLVVLGSFGSTRSWGPGGGLLSPGWAAHTHLSSRGRRSRPERVSAPCSRNAACWQIWNWRKPRSRRDAVTLLSARPVVAVMMMMMVMVRVMMMRGNPLYLRCEPETAPEPGSAERPEATSPWLLQVSLTSVHTDDCCLIHCPDIVETTQMSHV